jgi:hypothetical protein
LDYREIVPDPISLKEITSKLKRNKYPSLRDFREEIERCWSNAERYNGANHPIGHLAALMRLEFAKLFREVEVKTVSGFCAEVYRLRTRIGRLIARNPRFPQPEIETSDHGAFSVKKLPSAVDLQRLAMATDLLTDPQDHEDLRLVLQAHQPELVTGKSVVVVASSLRPDTFRAVRTSVKSALLRQGLEYPV